MSEDRNQHGPQLVRPANPPLPAIYFELADDAFRDEPIHYGVVDEQITEYDVAARLAYAVLIGANEVVDGDDLNPITVRDAVGGHIGFGGRESWRGAMGTAIWMPDSLCYEIISLEENVLPQYLPDFHAHWPSNTTGYLVDSGHNCTPIWIWANSFWNSTVAIVMFDQQYGLFCSAVGDCARDDHTH